MQPGSDSEPRKRLTKVTGTSDGGDTHRYPTTFADAHRTSADKEQRQRTDQGRTREPCRSLGNQPRVPGLLHLCNYYFRCCSVTSGLLSSLELHPRSPVGPASGLPASGWQVSQVPLAVTDGNEKQARSRLLPIQHIHTPQTVTPPSTSPRAGRSTSAGAPTQLCSPGLRDEGTAI